ncbi:MAG: gamma-glutamyltransferase, partial [Myxococcota bacterium]
RSKPRKFRPQYSATRGLTRSALKEQLAGADSIPAHGPLPVSVPGAVAGWTELHGKFGRLPLKSVLAPAIRYAKEGFPVTPLVAEYWGRNFRGFERSHQSGVLPDYKNAIATYLPRGRAPKAGEMFRNPDLAKTYQAIAEQGRDGFYKGSIATTIGRYMQRMGSALTAADLEAHTVDWVDPMRVRYRGYDVYELPPNGQGLAALQMLALLEPYDLKSMGAGSAKSIHLMVEAKRLAFEDRARFYADPDFYTLPPEKLLEDKRVAAQRKRIRPDRVMRSAEFPAPEDGDTTYLTVADKDGMMVSLIQSNYRGMGSGLVPDGLGFMLQDRGELFALEDGHANVYEPGKRPFHTIMPSLSATVR